MDHPTVLECEARTRLAGAALADIERRETASRPYAATVLLTSRQIIAQSCDLIAGINAQSAAGWWPHPIKPR